MKSIHLPRIDARYWLAITLASVFGTNLGDLYAHDSGLGIFRGLALLAALAAGVFVIERLDRWHHQIYYWLVIVIIRTGATNIADYLAFRQHISPILLSFGLAGIIAVCAVAAIRTQRAANATNATLPSTGAGYWVAMLAAGVFGTVLGDVSQHVFGQVPAVLGLSALVLVALFMRRRHALNPIALYWIVVATARTAGTAIGDALAENPAIDIGLPIATLITGSVFLAVLLFGFRKPAERKLDEAFKPAG